MTRVLTCLGMVSVLLLTSFVTNVYAAEDFPTYNEVKITVSGIPGQTGESVTDVDLTPSPCSAQNDTTCTWLLGHNDTRNWSRTSTRYFP